MSFGVQQLSNKHVRTGMDASRHEPRLSAIRSGSVPVNPASLHGVVFQNPRCPLESTPARRKGVSALAMESAAQRSRQR